MVEQDIYSMPQGGYISGEYRLQLTRTLLLDFYMICPFYIMTDYHFEMTDDTLFEMMISLINF